MEIRPATSTDAAVLSLLNAHVHDLHVRAEPHRYRVTRREELQARFEQVLADENVDIFLAMESGEAVGYVVAHAVRHEGNAYVAPDAYLLVDQLALAPTHRRRGIGRALMVAIHDRARERGLERVELDVRAHNGSAVAFYEALGYGIVQHRMCADV